MNKREAALNILAYIQCVYLSDYLGCRRCPRNEDGLCAELPTKEYMKESFKVITDEVDNVMGE